MEALPGSSGAETGGRLEDRAPSPDEQAEASPAWGSGLRGPSLAIFGFRGTEASCWLCCPRTGVRPPTVAEPGITSRSPTMG